MVDRRGGVVGELDKEGLVDRKGASRAVTEDCTGQVVRMVAAVECGAPLAVAKVARAVSDAVEFCAVGRVAAVVKGSLPPKKFPGGPCVTLGCTRIGCQTRHFSLG